MSVNVLEQAITMLKWAIANGKSLAETCKHFKRNERYFRDKKKKNKANELYGAFMALYKQAISRKSPEDSAKFIDNDPESGTERKTFTDNGDSALYEYKGNKMLTSLEEAIKFFEIDTSLWEVERWVCNSYPVSARRREQDLTWEKNAEGAQIMIGTSKRFDEWTTVVNYQVKVWLKKIKTDEELKQWASFIATISDHSPKYEKIVRSKNKKKKYVFELGLPDLHIGKLAWAPETGEDYDTKIAIDSYNAAIIELMEHVAPIADEIEEILLPIGNDLFNVDNFRNETTNGTPQHVDSRWQKMFLKAKDMLIENIDKLRLIAPVKIPVVVGNHDTQTAWYLGETLKAWYRNTNDITIDNSPAMRKYYSYGLNLIAWSHGNEEKHNDLGLIMANEEPMLWGATKFRSIHLGHWHKKKEMKWVDSDEHPGFKIKIIPSLSASDSWHAKKGYKTQRSAIGMLHHKDRGLIAEYTYNVD